MLPGSSGAVYRRLMRAYATIPPNTTTAAASRRYDYPRPCEGVLRLFGRRPARPGLRSTARAERVDVGLRLFKEGGSTAYADGIAPVVIRAVVSVDDVLFTFYEGESAAPSSRRSGDVHVFMDSALPHGTDLEANRGAVLARNRRCVGIKGMLNRDHFPRENCWKLLHLFGGSPGFRTLTRVNLPRVPEEPDDTHRQREAPCHYSSARQPNTRSPGSHWSHTALPAPLQSSLYGVPR